MCQPVSGPKFTLEKPRKMWKAVTIRGQHGINVSVGPFHTTEFRLDGWAMSRKPRKEADYTQAGYHVFASKKGADAYAKDMLRDLVVIPVLVRGQVLPFTYVHDFVAGKRYKGYAVQSWRRA